MQLNSIGIAGEVRCVVTKADGAVKTDTGYQKNLILNQGLFFFRGGKGTYINSKCAIGGGNSTPSISQTSLDVFIDIASGTDTTSSYSYEDIGDNKYRTWEQKKYQFTGLDNVNISEVGLVSTGSSSDYYLCTRALIKDISGVPATITVKAGETLDVYYKIHKVIDTQDKAFVVNVLDGSGNTTPYNITIRPQLVGNVQNDNLSRSIYGNSSRYSVVSPLDLVAITSEIKSGAGGASVMNSVSIENPIEGSFKTRVQVDYGLNQANINIRTMTPLIETMPIQVRFGRVSDDAPLTKTNKETLSIPLEFSWGRYEGAL